MIILKVYGLKLKIKNKNKTKHIVWLYIYNHDFSEFLNYLEMFLIKKVLLIKNHEIHKIEIKYVRYDFWNSFPFSKKWNNLSFLQAGVFANVLMFGKRHLSVRTYVLGLKPEY